MADSDVTAASVEGSRVVLMSSGAVEVVEVGGSSLRLDCKISGEPEDEA